MKILISGTSGLIGAHLVPLLEASGHEVTRLVRRPTGGERETPWLPDLQPDQVSGFDAVIHLAGETIMGRWTAGKKARILESRATGTRNLALAVAAAKVRPHSFLVASAVGYYGSRGDTILREDSSPGSDFLALVCQQWEASAEAARQAGVRVVNLRLGTVLTRHGGALPRLILPFRMGLGGRLGSGKQWMAWIALEDVIRAIGFTLETGSIAGPVNLIAPNPVTNREFTRALGQALHRPTPFPLPAALIKLAFGQMGEALLLSSQRALPGKLAAAGYRFLHPEVGEALRSMLR
jgi:hypothetical protein